MFISQTHPETPLISDLILILISLLIPLMVLLVPKTADVPLTAAEAVVLGHLIEIDP